MSALARHLLAVSSFLALLIFATNVYAKPQTNAGLLAGVCARGEGSSYWDETCFYGGARVDAIFGQEGPRDFGVGPYMAMTTAGFDDVRLGGGATLHIPIDETFPLLLSAGGFAKAAHTWEGGMSLQLFFGPRSFNYHHVYVLSGGIVAGIDRTFGASQENVFVLAAQIDAFVLALPFLIAYESLRGHDD